LFYQKAIEQSVIIDVISEGLKVNRSEAEEIFRKEILNEKETA
jgi:hypothetical protein